MFVYYVLNRTVTTSHTSASHNTKICNESHSLPCLICKPILTFSIFFHWTWPCPFLLSPISLIARLLASSAVLARDLESSNQPEINYLSWAQLSLIALLCPIGTFSSSVESHAPVGLDGECIWHLVDVGSIHSNVHFIMSLSL